VDEVMPQDLLIDEAVADESLDEHAQHLMDSEKLDVANKGSTKTF
jgi:hypothetical protein